MHQKCHKSAACDYQGTIPIDAWERLMKSMEGRPWRESLEVEKIPKYSWFTNGGKSLFYSKVECRRERFLDVGAGSGVISAALSGGFKAGVAMDLCEYCVKFMVQRFRQDNISNIRPVQGDGLSLPFADESFDLVVCNGVLEWVGTKHRQGSCRDAQLAFLKEIRRCLRSGGKIAIAIENRWDLRYFKGVDPHGEPPFVALMPRPLARLVHYLIRGEDYRTYIYGQRGYRHLLADADFSEVKINLAVPNYYDPEQVTDTDFDSVREMFQEYRKRKPGSLVMAVRGVLCRLGWLPFFWPAFFIEATVRR